MATQTTRSMISETSICNQALSWLGASQIESLEEPNSAAEYCRNNYPFIRDAVLEEHFWSFAVARHVSTAADQPTSPSWGTGLYIHAVPLDWLQVFRVYDGPYGDQYPQWTREGTDILADVATVYMYGIKRIVDTGKFSSLFVQALAARLAAELALPLTGKSSLQERMWVLYERKLEDAAARDGMQGRNEVIEQRTLIDARFNDGAAIGAR